MVETTAVRRGYVDTTVGQVHYRQVRGRGRPLVLLHQSPASSRMYERAYPRFAVRSLPVIAFDTPGFGMSDVPDHPPSITEYADWLAEAIRAVTEGPVFLGGHHTGAAIAAELATRHSGLAAALVLSGPPMFDEARRASYSTHRREGVELRPDGSHLVELFDRRVQATPGWTDLESMHRGVVDTLLNGGTAWYGHRAAYDYDMEPAVRSISVPTLIVSNSGDEVHEESLRVCRLRPDFELAALVGGTHDVVDEMPEQWVEVIADFIQGLSDTATSDGAIIQPTGR